MAGHDSLHRRNGSFFLSLIFVLYVAGSSSAMMAQERYSANSLMAAFDNFSKTSPKGTAITLTDVVLESKKTKIVFKSSKNGKVVCELASPLSEDIASGTSLTVVGKVRGRGMLGNVTLDDCSLKRNEAVAEASPVAIPETAPVRIEVPAAPLANPIVAPVAPPVVAKASPAPVPASVPAVVPRKQVPAKETQPVEMPRAVDEVPDHDDGLMPKNLQLPLHPAEPQSQPSEGVSSSGRSSFVNLFYALGGFLVGILVLVSVKKITAPREDNDQQVPNTPEVRRVALEELLSRRKK